MHILVPSIVPPTFSGGAGAVTRGLIALLQAPPFSATLTVVTGLARSRTRHVLRQGAAFVTALAGRAPAKVAFHDASALRQRIQRGLAGAPIDLVLVNGTDMAWALDILPPGVPRALVVHNIEHEIYRAQMTQHPWGGLVPRVLAADARRLQMFEARVLAATPGLFISRHDFTSGPARHPLSRLIAPVFAYPLPAPRPVHAPTGPLRLGMVGNFGWWPNRDAARWFMDEVMPALGGRAVLHLFGNRSPALAAGRPHVTAHGFLARIDAAFDACDLMISPARTGGGVSIKLAEALYHRAPVMATPFAMRGLPAFADDAVIVLPDDARDWIAFLTSPAARDLATRRVSERVARLFSRDAARADVEAFVNGVRAQSV